MDQRDEAVSDIAEACAWALSVCLDQQANHQRTHLMRELTVTPRHAILDCPPLAFGVFAADACLTKRPLIALRLLADPTRYVLLPIF